MQPFKKHTSEQAAVTPQQHQIAVNDLVLITAGQPDPQNLFSRAVIWFKAVTDASIVILYCYDAATQHLIEPVSSGVESLDLPSQIELGVGIYGDVARSHTTRLIENIKVGSRFGAVDGMKTALVTPLVYEGTLLGVISLQWDRARSIGEAERNMFELAAKVLAAQALVTQRFAESQAVIERFERFQTLTQTLTEQLIVEDLMQNIVDAAREMLRTPASILFEVKDERLSPVGWSGAEAEDVQKLYIPLKIGLKGIVAWARRPARLDDLLPEQRRAPGYQTTLPGTVSEMAAPIMHQDEIYGLLAVETNTNRAFSDEEMSLLASLAAQAGIALRNAQLFEAGKRSNEEMEYVIGRLLDTQDQLEEAHQARIKAYEAELETARAIQVSLLPQDVPPVPQISLAARAIPARHVSGDFYQYLLLPDGKLAIAIGDVSGKGIPAALLMAVTTTVFRDEVVRIPNPADLLSSMNAHLLPRMRQNDMNSALMVTVYDPHAQQIEIANGGMVQPYLFSDHTWEAIAVGGYPLGASDRIAYSAKTLPFESGALLVYVSDGVTECMNPNREMFSFDRLEALLTSIDPRSTPQEIVNIIFDTVYAFLDGQEPQDDITVVALKCN